MKVVVVLPGVGTEHQGGKWLVWRARAGMDPKQGMGCLKKHLPNPLQVP